MSDKKYMPLADFENDEKLKTAKVYKKLVEEKNFNRSIIGRKLLYRKRAFLAGSFALVLSIYSFSIYKIRQETFLDDFEEPPRILKS